MKHFVDCFGETVFLLPNTEDHIAYVHPEIDLAQIRNALANPDEIRQSSYRATTILYYRLRSSRRFVCIVVKRCSDGLFISTALTTTKPKVGEVIYAKQS